MGIKEFNLEVHSEDRNRIRIVLGGKVSRWFSRLLHTGDDGLLVVPEDIILTLGLDN